MFLWMPWHTLDSFRGNLNVSWGWAIRAEQFGGMGGNYFPNQPISWQSDWISKDSVLEHTKRYDTQHQKDAHNWIHTKPPEEILGPKKVRIHRRREERCWSDWRGCFRKSEFLATSEECLYPTHDPAACCIISQAILLSLKFSNSFRLIQKEYKTTKYRSDLHASTVQCIDHLIMCVSETVLFCGTSLYAAIQACRAFSCGCLKGFWCPWVPCQSTQGREWHAQ